MEETVTFQTTLGKDTRCTIPPATIKVLNAKPGDTLNLLVLSITCMEDETNAP